METTEAQRAAGLADQVWGPFVRALCRDVDTLTAALRDRAGAAHDFGAVLDFDRTGHRGDFQDCQNGKCIEARALLEPSPDKHPEQKEAR